MSYDGSDEPKFEGKELTDKVSTMLNEVVVLSDVATLPSVEDYCFAIQVKVILEDWLDSLKNRF